MRGSKRVFLAILTLSLLSCSAHETIEGGGAERDLQQTRGWSADDHEFFLYGSMCDEFIPERALLAFQKTYPDLFPGGDLRAYGVIRRGDGLLPVGFSRAKIGHLGDQWAWGINCASCHTAEVREPDGGRAMLIYGPPGVFNVFDFLGAVAVAMVRTQDSANLATFLEHYLDDAEALPYLRHELIRQAAAIRAAIAEDPFGSKGQGPRELHEIEAYDLDLTGRKVRRGDDLAPFVRALLRLFHNVRACAGLPEELVDTGATVPGPGRTDAFGVLAIGLLGQVPEASAPVKYGVLFNLSKRDWVHWDGNNNNVVGRNVAAVLGLGAPSPDKLHMPHLLRHTALTESIRHPIWPWSVDGAMAERGAKHYAAHCASCHDGPQDDSKLFDTDTDPNRLIAFKDEYARGFNEWLRAQDVPGYTDKRDWVRPTGKYWAAPMEGVWARAPYMHNGSVRTMWDLLTPPAQRPAKWRRGTTVYDREAMGFADGGNFAFDTTKSGNSAAGHDYGTGLSDAEKRELVEYLKTR